MSKISELSLVKIVNGIKKKDFTSEEVTKSFIDISKKSKKLNAYITECFEEALGFSKNFDGGGGAWGEAGVRGRTFGGVQEQQKHAKNLAGIST